VRSAVSVKFDYPGTAWLERAQSHLRRSCIERL